MDKNGPPMAPMNSVRIRDLAGSALPTTACVRCGSQAGVIPVGIPRTFPPGLLFGIAFALPLLLALVLPALLVGVSILAPRVERYPLECPYGTYPLSHRSGLR